jgi:hypothetical protein
MSDTDASGEDDAVVIACIQELDEFITRKLHRYPPDAVAVAAGSYLAGLLGALFDERLFTADEVHELLREIESDILDPERRGPEPAIAERLASSGVALGSISVCSYSIRNRSGWRGYGRPPPSRVESPTTCHTSCHTDLVAVGKESASR